jgi:hypothetical protein
MKKQPFTNYPVPVPNIKSLPISGRQLPDSKKEKKAPEVTPPDEEKLIRLNNIAKESPFCFYYKEKNNGFL